MAAGYYVTVRDAGRWRPLLGPFGAREDAESLVDAAADLCVDIWPWSHFYTFGVSRIEGMDLPAGVLDTISTWRMRR